MLFSLLFYLFLYLLLFATVHSSLTFSIAWIERRLERQRSYYYQQEKPAFFVLARAFLSELSLLFLAGLSTPFLFFPAKKKKPSSTLIVFVHGYAHNHTACFFLQKYLEAKGLESFHRVNLFPPFGTVESHAKQLQESIDKIKEKDEKVILVGHSMGGLVASFYAENLAQKGEVIQIISLGSPLQGTRLAAFGIGKSAAQMAPNSPFLLKLQEQIRSSSVAYYHLASRIDNIIVPWNSALLSKDKDKEFIVPDLSHLSLLVSPVVAERVFQWLLRHEKISKSALAEFA